MNTVEGILSEIGEDTLSSHDGSKNLLIYLNAAMRDTLPERLTGAETGFVVLGLIYEIPELDKQIIVLDKIIKYDETKYDRFKVTLTVVMVVIVSVVIFMAANVLILGRPMDDASTDILKMVLYNLFEIAKHVLVISYPTSP